MSEENNKKNLISTDPQIAEDRELLRQYLLFKTNEKLDQNTSDERIDREAQKIELRSGKFIDVLELEKVIRDAINKYEPRFPSDYFKHIYRLNGWEVPDVMPYRKRSIVGTFTNEIIYGRFKQDVLPALRLLNPYVVTGQREHKHHQFLTDDGLKKLDRFLAETIVLMSQSDTWNEFRLKLFNKFGIPYQTTVFN